MKSASSRTALLPSETMSLKPMSSSLAQSMTAVMNAPDWLMKDMLPSRAMSGPNVAFMPTSVFMMPRLFGPTTLRSYSSAMSRSSCSRAAPSLPVSPKPAVMTTTFWMPASPADFIAGRTTFGGTTMTARSASVSPTSP